MGSGAGGPSWPARCPTASDRLLEVGELLVQRVDLRLGVRRRGGRDRGLELGRGDPDGRGRVRSSSSSSSWRPDTSVFRMRIDLPSERAAAGSLRAPNSTMSTTAMIRIFHGLSNRSPIHLRP